MTARSEALPGDPARPATAELHTGPSTADPVVAGVPEGVCECGDWQSQHVLERGNCRVCRFGTPPPDGPDGCQRYREAWTEDHPRGVHGRSDLERRADALAALAGSVRRAFIGGAP